jgi:hypothetical protein
MHCRHTNIPPGLLPLLIWRGMSDADQRYRIEKPVPSLARDAAACAIGACDPYRSIEMLEKGRGILWAQRLELREDLTRLDRVRRDLWQQLGQCGAALRRLESNVEV